MLAMFAPLSPNAEVLPCCIDMTEEERARVLSEYVEWAFERGWCDYVTEQEVEFDEGECGRIARAHAPLGKGGGHARRARPSSL